MVLFILYTAADAKHKPNFQFLQFFPTAEKRVHVSNFGERAQRVSIPNMSGSSPGKLALATVGQDWTLPNDKIARGSAGSSHVEWAVTSRESVERHAVRGCSRNNTRKKKKGAPRNTCTPPYSYTAGWLAQATQRTTRR